jgi:CRP/FNR family transcriptional regulator, cyclic AMP receptor protein
MAGAPVEALRRVPLFADLDGDELQQVALLFKRRTFAQGETVMREGTDGAAFFLIETGEASVSVAGTARANLRAGDHFGEIALIDEGVRSATITASPTSTATASRTGSFGRCCSQTARSA